MYLSNNRGSALLIALCLMALFGLLAISVVEQSHTNMELSFNQVQEDQAFYLAEAGAKRALGVLNTDTDWRTGYQDEEYGVGMYTVIMTDSSTDTTLADTIRIVSTGSVDGARAVIELLVGPEIN